MNSDPRLGNKICTFKANWRKAPVRGTGDDRNMKNFVNPHHAPAPFCGAWPNDIKTNALFRVTTHRISHSTPVRGVALLNDVAPPRPVRFQKLKPFNFKPISDVSALTI